MVRRPHIKKHQWIEAAQAWEANSLGFTLSPRTIQLCDLD